MILACQNISKSFGVEPVIRNVSFHVEDQEKVRIYTKHLEKRSS